MAEEVSLDTLQEYLRIFNAILGPIVSNNLSPAMLIENVIRPAVVSVSNKMAEQIHRHYAVMGSWQARSISEAARSIPPQMLANLNKYFDIVIENKSVRPLARTAVASVNISFKWDDTAALDIRILDEADITKKLAYGYFRRAGIVFPNKEVAKRLNGPDREKIPSIFRIDQIGPVFPRYWDFSPPRNKLPYTGGKGYYWWRIVEGGTSRTGDVLPHLGLPTFGTNKPRKALLVGIGNGGYLFRSRAPRVVTKGNPSGVIDSKGFINSRWISELGDSLRANLLKYFDQIFATEVEPRIMSSGFPPEVSRTLKNISKARRFRPMR